MTPSFSKELQSTEDTLQQAKPFLKWVGGKQQLLAQFEAYFPQRFDRYFEPFVGGGAVFFHLWNTNRLPQHVFLLDNNEALINAFRVVRDNVDALVERLAEHKAKHSKEYYYHIRKLDREDIALTDVERAARTIYLNKTCYNGLYRVNRKGQFNVPMGSYKNPRILHEDVLAAASIALQHVTLAVGDFRDLLTLAQKGDFIYFDPPYDPLSKTASFTSYTAGDFGDQDQRDLADVFAALTEKGCLCMLSNSYTEFIQELYTPFKIEVVYAKRAVNSDANGRGNIKEAFILNY
ncbi:MAG: DNA adenine methylase [Anaerolineae bacterium]|nr:DNA adenine methylase [Anaerolineae bacterium]